MAPRNKQKRRRLVGPVIGVFVVTGAAAGVWLLSKNIAGVSRPSEITPTVNLLPPPPPAPPPPPPPKEPPPPPDKEMEPPKPQEAKADNQPKQLTIAGPAQAGGDAFGIKAGSGGGSTVLGGPSEGGGGGGGGFEETSYASFLSSVIQQSVQGNPRIDHQFATAELAVWIDSGGRVTRAKIRRSSGDGKVDEELVATLEHMRPLSEPPPAQFRFPREIRVRGARSG